MSEAGLNPASIDIYEVIMTSKEMFKTKLPDGHIFKDVSKLGHKPDWKIVKKPETWGMKTALGINGLIRVK